MNCLFFFFLSNIIFCIFAEGIVCPSDENIFLPDPDDCSKYWECINGNGYQFVCPNGLLWNQIVEQCDYPVNVDCASTNQPLTSTTDSSFTPNPLCPYPSDNITFLPDPDDCSKYYECYEGVLTTMDCQNGLLWNQEQETCDYPENVDCASTKDPFTSTTDSSFTPNPLCPYPSENITFLPDPDDCSKYYECYEGVLSIMDCQSGLLWNQDEETCDYPENVICNETSKPIETTTNNFTPNPLCPYPSDIITFLPDSDDCSKYYECYEGVLTVNDCPGNLLWNQDLETCDYPQNVDCDGK